MGVREGVCDRLIVGSKAENAIKLEAKMGKVLDSKGPFQKLNRFTKLSKNRVKKVVVRY